MTHVLAEEKSNDHSHIKTLDRLSDKILIIFMLIPFGLNLFTFLIISAESIFAFQAIYSKEHPKTDDRIEKAKIILQVFLIPILILQIVTSFIPELFVYLYMVITIISTYTSIYSRYSRYFYFKN
ncbi:MAG: CDP-alcohol phosphatidyltransferase family protein [Candidatus Paceibacterota bacterium]